MIPFIDKLYENNVLKFDNNFLDRFLSIRMILLLICIVVISICIVIIFIPITIFNIINNILDLSKYIYIELKNHPRFQKSRIKYIMCNYYSKLEKEELLYLQYKDTTFEEDNLKDFIINFFTIYNKKYNTYLESITRISETENDLFPPLGKFSFEFIRNSNHKYNSDLYYYDCYCTTNRRRSLGDIYRICKTYFPSTKIEEVLEILIDLCESKELSGSYCNTIQKFVFHKQNENFYPKGKTEYGDITFKDVIWYIKNK